jgi:hypothetical protein
MKRFGLLALMSGAAMVLSVPAMANLITNGDFESGSLAGWTTATSGGSNNFFVISNGANAPLSLALTQSNVGGGNFVAMGDQTTSGGEVIFQSFTTTGGTLTLKFDYFDNSHFGLGQSGTDIAGVGQTARVDILSANAAAFDVGSGVVQNLFIGMQGPLPGGNETALTATVPWQSVTDTVTGLAAGTYQLRFGNGQCCYFQEFGVDNVSLEASVPEPSTWAMMLLGFAGIGFMAYRRKSKPVLMAA